MYKSLLKKSWRFESLTPYIYSRVCYIFKQNGVEKYLSCIILLMKTRSPVAFITHVKTELGIKPSPMMGDFSSRGPNPIIDSMIKVGLLNKFFTIFKSHFQTRSYSNFFLLDLCSLILQHRVWIYSQQSPNLLRQQIFHSKHVRCLLTLKLVLLCLVHTSQVLLAFSRHFIPNGAQQPSNLLSWLQVPSNSHIFWFRV